jgi:hypothetical protein
MQVGLEVSGLKELRAALKKLDTEQLKALRDGLKKAGDIVAGDARVKASLFSKRAAATIRATAGGNTVYVQGGKAKLPWYGWADFGSRKPVSGNPRSVGPWAGSGKGPTHGRFIYKARDDKFDDVVKAVAEALDASIKQAGF